MNLRIVFAARYKVPMQSVTMLFAYVCLVINGKVCVTYVPQTTRVESLQSFIGAFFQKNIKIYSTISFEIWFFDIQNTYTNERVRNTFSTTPLSRDIVVLSLLRQTNKLLVCDKRISVAVFYARLVRNGKVCREILSACNAIVHFEIFFRLFLG